MSVVTQQVRSRWLSASGVRVGHRWVVAGTVGVALANLSLVIDKNWYPWDEGVLGQMAQRVLDGQLPHRDFADIYTGGLSFYDAGVFWLFGTNTLWLRFAILPFYVAFLVATYFIATRLVGKGGAALITLAAGVWTLPSYPAPMPSWFNLFLGVIGLALVTRWLETERPWLLWVAGACGGASIVVKVIGVYYVVAVVLFLSVRPQLGEERALSAESPRRFRPPVAVGAITLGAVAFGVAILAPRLGPREFVAFLVPILAAATVPFGLAARRAAAAATAFGRDDAANVARFMAGAAIPLACFAIPYAATGSLGDLIEGVFSARSRLTFASAAPASLPMYAWAAPLVAALLVPLLPPRVRSLLALPFIVAYAGLTTIGQRQIAEWWYLRPLHAALPLIAVAVAFTLVVRATRPTLRTRLLCLLGFTTAWMGLVEFPFAGFIYFLYFAPLALLTLVALLGELAVLRHWLYVAILASYVIGAVVSFHSALDQRMHRTKYAQLSGERAAIDVPAQDAAKYHRIVTVLRAHARNGVTLAAPDAPEVYYLAGLRNPTPLLFDFLTPRADRDKSILDALSSGAITAVAINRDPSFSPPLDRPIERRLEQLFPEDERIANFDIRWRQ